MHCLDAADLAVVKLTVGREKDLALLRALLARGVLTPTQLRGRYRETPMEEALLFKAGRNLKAVLDNEV